MRTRIVRVDASGAEIAASERAVSRAEFSRALAQKESLAAALMKNPAIFGVGVGASNDSPGEAAIVLFVDTTKDFVPPPVLNGVRTVIRRSERFRAQYWNEHVQPRPACSMKAVAHSLDPHSLD